MKDLGLILRGGRVEGAGGWWGGVKPENLEKNPRSSRYIKLSM